MAQLYFNQNNFNAGQLSYKMHKRSDLTPYQNGLKECVNFLPQVHGPAKKRPGTRRVGAVPARSSIRLIPFVFSSTVSYVLEFTNLKMRVYKDGALVGAPFVLTTTITTAMLEELQYTQNGDTMYLVHNSLAPQILTRFSDTSWTIHALEFVPPPMYEAGATAATTMTLGAASGSGVSLTAGANFFLAGDETRLLVEKNGPGIGVIASVTAATTGTLDVLTTFSDTSLASGEWLLLGSPSADLWIPEIGLVGKTVTILPHVTIDQTSNAELMNDGSFASDFAANDWDNRSAPQVGTGTVDADTDDGTVVDDGSFNFITKGIQENYYFENSTQGHRNYVTKIVASNNLIVDKADADYDIGDTWICTQTGAAFIDTTNGKCTINGERNGIGWIEQARSSLTTDRIFCLRFRVEDAPVSLQIGSSSRASDKLEEKSYEIGEHEVYFYNDSSALYIQFRNNQQTNAAVTGVTMKLVSESVFRAADVGKYIRVLGGVIEITTVAANGDRATGIIRSELVAAETVKDVREVGGLWSLESESFSSANGYPRVVAMHDQRLYLGSTTEHPTTIWGSVISEFTDFNRGESNDDDSLIITPTSTEINQFRWMVAEHNLVIGTGRNEFIVSPGLGDATITPTTRKVDIPSQWGSTAHRPVRVGDAIVFIERNGTILREMTTTVEGNVQSNRELNILTDGMADAGIKEIAFQQRPTPTIWAVLNDGSVLSGVYLQGEEVMGWVRHDFGGDVYAVAVIPTETTDQVWFAIDRFGGTSVEYMQETEGVFGHLVTDSTYVYEGSETDEIDGLFWLEGKLVDIVVEGEEYARQRVSCGHVGGLEPQVTYAEVGLPVEAYMIFLDPDTPQQPTTGYTINGIKIALSLYESSGGQLNSQSLYTVFEYPFDMEDGLYTGTLPMHGINHDGKMPEIVLYHDEPKPFMLRAITYLIDRSDL